MSQLTKRRDICWRHPSTFSKIKWSANFHYATVLVHWKNGGESIEYIFRCKDHIYLARPGPGGWWEETNPDSWKGFAIIAIMGEKTKAK